jgi:hypothetical protein
MRLAADFKMGYFPLPAEHGPNIRARLSFPERESQRLSTRAPEPKRRCMRPHTIPVPMMK